MALIKDIAENKKGSSFFVTLYRRLFELNAVKVYMSDVSVRYSVNLLRSLITGILYSFFNSFAALLYESAWFFAVAIYYMLLVTVRYVLFVIGKKHEQNDACGIEIYKSCRNVGVLMLSLNMAMALTIVYTIAQQKVINHSPLVVYLLALYTVSICIFNVASVVINRKRKLPYSYLISRIISLCASFMSVFNLINSLAVYVVNPSLSLILRWSVGAGVIFAVLALCLAVIIKCTRRIAAYGKT